MCLGIPGKLLSVEGEDPLFRSGKVEFSGVTREVNLAYVPDAQPGQYVIVHVGFAISVLDEKSAAEVSELISQVTQ